MIEARFSLKTASLNCKISSPLFKTQSCLWKVYTINLYVPSSCSALNAYLFIYHFFLFYSSDAARQCFVIVMMWFNVIDDIMASNLQCIHHAYKLMLCLHVFIPTEPQRRVCCSTTTTYLSAIKHWRNSIMCFFQGGNNRIY